MQSDSIAKVIHDSLQAIKVDSLARLDSVYRADSLARLDSIRVADSIKLVLHRNSGCQGTLHPSLAQTEDWVVMVMLVLFCLLVFSVSRSGSLIPETIKNFFQLKERSSIFSKATVNDFKIRFLIILFSIAVLSFYAYLILHPIGTAFSFFHFALIALATYLYYWIKAVLFDLMGYVFLEPISTKMAKDSYFNVLSLVGICLFPLLLVQIYNPYGFEDITKHISLSICVLGYLIVIFRLFQIFLHKILASFYILLYLCTLEFLPLAGLYFAYIMINQSVL